MGNSVKRAIKNIGVTRRRRGLRRLDSGFLTPGWWEEWQDEQGALCKYWSIDGGCVFILVCFWGIRGYTFKKAFSLK